MDNDIAQINKKLDYLTEQFEAQRERQEGINELVHDAVPIVNHMIKLSIDELAEISTDFELEDLTFLLKRLLRDTRMLVGFLDQMESLSELAQEGQVMGKRIFHQVTMELDRLEREGYFDIARAGMEVADKLVHQIDGDDVRKLGSNLVESMQADIPENPSLLSLLRKLNDPQVKRGLYRSLNLLKTIGA